MANPSDDLKGSGKSASTNAGETLSLDMPADLLKKLDAWITEQPGPRLNRSDAAKRILGDALAGVGDVSIPVEELNSSNDE